MTLPPLWPVPRSVSILQGRGLKPKRGWRIVGEVPAACGADGLSVEFADLVTADGDGVLRLVRDGDLPAEGYRLRHNCDGASLAHADAAGCRHGLRTLRQLLAGPGAPPSTCIRDAPAVAVRGVMLDCARDRIPTMAELERIVASLAALKGNHLQLYTEHNVAYAGHEAVWRDADPLTGDELRRLDDSCRAHGIALAANQNCLGHMERWFKHAPYDELAELPDVRQRIDPFRFAPWSLNPVDPRSLELVTGLLDQLLPCFTADLVNIGCDETADIGTGRSADAVARRGYGEVYGGFVGAVARACLERGRRPQFWGDVALDHPDALARIPAEAIALAWGYEADADFAAWGRALAAGGRSWWACPGTSAWNSFGGRTDARRGSIRRAVAAATGHGAEGVLITEWGDRGHRQQWPVTLYALAEGLGTAWNPAAPEDPAAVGACALGSAALGRWLEGIAACDVGLRATARNPHRDAPLANATVPFTDTLLPWDHRGWLDDDAPWAALAECLQDLGEPPADAPQPLAGECAHTQEVLRLAVDRARARRATGSGASLADRWRQVARDHQRHWLARSRPGGLRDSVGWYTRLVEETEDRAT